MVEFLASRSGVRVLAGDFRGTGYRVGPDLVATAAQVVPHRYRVAGGPAVSVQFGSARVDALVEAVDDGADVCLLRLLDPAPAGAVYDFAQASVGPCDFEPSEALPEGAMHGVLLDVDVLDPYGDRRMTLHAPELATAMLEEQQPYSGAPVLLEGRVVGHLTNAIRNPNAMAESFVGLVQAVPSQAMLELMGSESSPPAPPGRQEPVTPRPLESGQRYHVFVSYRAIENRKGNDEDYTHALIDRLESWGFSCHPAPHVLYGDDPSREEHREALQRSACALLLFSKDWLREPSFEKQVKRILKRSSKDPDARLVVVRLDDTPLPPLVAEVPGVRVLDLGAERLRLDKHRPPTARAIRWIARTINGAHPEAAEDPSAGEASREAVAQAVLDQVEDEVMEELSRVRSEGKRAKEPNPLSIQALATRWLQVGLGGSDVPVEAARLMNSWVAYEEALEVLDRAATALDADDRRDRRRIERMRGVCLSELGHEDEAISVLESVAREGVLDTWAGGILGGIYKRLWLQLGSSRRSLLERAYRIYRDTYGRTLHYYPGINAATLARLLGHDEEARLIAEAIRDELLREGDRYYWDEATLGEAYLLLGEYEQALPPYTKAALMAMKSARDMVSMRRQFPLIFGEPGRDPKADATRARLEALFNFGHVVAFAGHLAEQESAVRLDTTLREARTGLRNALRESDASIGFCTLETPLDVVFVDGMLERSGSVHLYLPYLARAYRERLPEEMRSEFDRIVADDRVTVEELSDTLPRDPADSCRTLGAAILDGALAHARTLEDVEHTTLITVQPPRWGAPNSSAATEFVPYLTHAATGEGLNVITLQAGGPSRSSEEAREVGTGAGHGPGPGDPGELVSEEERRRGRFRGTVFASPEGGLLEPGAYRKRHLAVVGIDHYVGGWKPLRNAKNDARGVRDLLVGEYGFAVSTELFDEEATRDAIENAFVEGLNRGRGDSGEVQPDDLVVFFFAGHGHTERQLNDRAEGFLVPYGVPEGLLAGLLRFSTLRGWTVDLPARHVLFILDSCFSGVAATGGGGDGEQGYARRVITAGDPLQVVADGGSRPHHSIFTARLLEGLENDPGLSKPIDDLGLTSYLVRRVPEDAREAGQPSQTPSHGLLPRHGGDVIVLTRVG